MPDLSSEHWFLRIDDISGFNIQNLIEAKDYGVVYVVRESPELNPHYHILLKYKQIRTKSTINKYLKELFPVLHGNGVFSNKTVEDVQAVLRYMSKGTHHGYTQQNPNVVHNTNVDVQYQHNEYWRVFKGLSGGKSTKSESTSDRYIREVRELVAKRTFKDPSFTDLTNLLMEVSKGKLNDNVAFACIQSLLWHYHPKETGETFTQRLYARFYRQ